MKVEEKLYNNRHVVDEGRPHVAVVGHGTPSKALKSLVTVCPAGCYAEEEDGSVAVTGELKWDYPRGGYGILFKFG